MKKSILLVLVLLSFSCVSFGQEETSKKLPPLKMLPAKPGEVKQIYELPDSTNYSVYNQKGKLVDSGNAEFVDFTKYKSGTYFIKYDGVSRKIEKE